MFDITKLQKLKKEDREDILELARRTADLRAGKEDEERFKHYRLTRGVYGQRQHGVQMFRTKIPFGKITANQLRVLADLSEKYGNANLHLTTRQNVQLHYVPLEDATKIWIGLSEAGMTGREACGNTVRNITASAKAGIDPDEPFDVTPYVQAMFEYFLRNPICQDMGRKIKTAFSASEKDSAFTYIHDFGFIPRIKNEDGKEVRGFKVVVGGGLGAVPFPAHVVYEFLPEDQIIPFKEAALRVFDRYGEREKRMKARMKFLIKKMGIEKFLELVEIERASLSQKSIPIDRNAVPQAIPNFDKNAPTNIPTDEEKFALWVKTNVFEQKQKDWFAVQVKVRLGDLKPDIARRLAELVEAYAADDIRITMNQGLILRFVKSENLAYLHNELNKLGLGDPGFDSTADITACPGTDTCALGVTNSTGLANRLEEVVRDEFPHLLEETNLKIKISGCMNSCGQHMAASIGFHGSSIKRDQRVIPAMQIVLGGGVDPNGEGLMATKIIKLPTKRIPEALRVLLDDYEERGEDRYFNAYFRSEDKRYFYDLLKPLADLESLAGDDVFDWGQNKEYIQSIGVGECAGVAFDVVGAIIGDAQKKIDLSRALLAEGRYPEATYNAYTGFVIGAKASLLVRDVKCNTHIAIIEDFQTHCVETGEFGIGKAETFPHLVLQINQNEPEADFTEKYVEQAAEFLNQVIEKRQRELVNSGGEDKLVLENYRA